MGTVTPASLELSLRNCSISSPSSPPLDQQTSAAACHWEQCIHFKTGEIYYVNRRTGKKVKDDPRKETETSKPDISSEEEENNSEKSNTSLPPPPPPPPTTTPPSSIDDSKYEEDVLVVAGCKSCLMYFMLPKTTDQCPKCDSNLLLHFDQPEK